MINTIMNIVLHEARLKELKEKLNIDEVMEEYNKILKKESNLGASPRKLIKKYVEENLNIKEEENGK